MINGCWFYVALSFACLSRYVLAKNSTRETRAVDQDYLMTIQDAMSTWVYADNPARSSPKRGAAFQLELDKIATRDAEINRERDRDAARAIRPPAVPVATIPARVGNVKGGGGGDSAKTAGPTPARV
jgi:hypothetical protein